MLRVFLWEIGMFSWDFPIDTEGIIKDIDTTISLWMIEVITFYWIIPRMGLSAKTGLSPDISGVFILFLFNTDWFIWWCACGCVWDKNLDKHPVGKLLCFEFMMVDASDAFTWTRFTTCVRDIHLSCAMQHIATQGDKQDKNRCADEWEVGGLAMVAHYLYIVWYSAWGLSAKLGFSPWGERVLNSTWWKLSRLGVGNLVHGRTAETNYINDSKYESWRHRGLLFCFFLSHVKSTIHAFWQKRYKNPWWFSVPAARWWSLAISYVNEFSTLWPISFNSGWRHTEKPSGDKQDKNRCADGKTIINYRAWCSTSSKFTSAKSAPTIVTRLLYLRISFPFLICLE